ncbi:hypothetical protein AOQ88_01440 [Candidatus Riesia sp. GBBU]|nr:hypothetical protein AOQ88_01440 [Candidatus Riesia sp. GBBU]
MKSKYIAIEGIDGSGKTTATKVVFNILKSAGIKRIKIIKQLKGTNLGKELSKLVLNKNKEKIEKKSELLIFYAAHVQTVKTVISPLLEKGIWIISDRCDLSSYAYQGGGKGIDLELIEKLKNIMLNDFNPDLIIYLDVLPEIGLNRIKNRKNIDVMEKNPLYFFKKVRNCYLSLLTKYSSFIRINSNHPIEIVEKHIYINVMKWLLQQNELVSLA